MPPVKAVRDVRVVVSADLSVAPGANAGRHWEHGAVADAVVTMILSIPGRNR